MSIKELLVVFVLLFSTSALADDLLDNSWGDNEEDTLKYNAFENEWDYAGDDDTLKYNAFENKWDYADEDD